MQMVRWRIWPISTHSLTRRLTAQTPGKAYAQYISTHSLTRRLTWGFWGKRNEIENFNSQPHKEADSKAMIRMIRISKFQLTASQGG